MVQKIRLFSAYGVSRRVNAKASRRERVFDILDRLAGSLDTCVTMSDVELLRHSGPFGSSAIRFQA